MIVAFFAAAAATTADSLALSLDSVRFFLFFFCYPVLCVRRRYDALMVTSSLSSWCFFSVYNLAVQLLVDASICGSRERLRRHLEAELKCFRLCAPSPPITLDCLSMTLCECFTMPKLPPPQPSASGAAVSLLRQPAKEDLVHRPSRALLTATAATTTIEFLCSQNTYTHTQFAGPLRDGFTFIRPTFV